MPAIIVSDVKKKFHVYRDKSYSLKERLLFRNRSRYEERWVLNGISFEVRKGEAIGLIGHNGCGKSTLLKLMTKIMYPDSGFILMNGRVSSLIELGAGFHQDMSGRENIYTNAAIFGLSRKEIEARVNDIIEFSELGEAIDNPVRTYSSGMYMRLAFSVAINVDADILLIDEILAVGDASFQAKCFNKLQAIKARGVTIVIVSHSLGQIEQFCERSIWIDGGLIRNIGTPREVHPSYLHYMGEKNAEIESEESLDSDLSIDEIHPPELVSKREIPQQDRTDNRWGNGDAKITKVIIRDESGSETTHLQTGTNAAIEIHYICKRHVRDPNVGVAFYRSDGVYCYGTNTLLDRLDPYELDNDGIVTFLIEEINLLPSEYCLDVAISSGNIFNCDYWKDAARFQTYSDKQDIGLTRLMHKWNFG